MRVEGVKRGLQLRRELERVEVTGLAGALARQAAPALLQDLPKVAIDRHVAGRQVVVDRHTGQLDDAALDGVHQGEIADRPRK